jgi:hypothetical protein
VGPSSCRAYSASTANSGSRSSRPLKSSLARLGLERGLPLGLAAALVIGLPIWSLTGGANVATPNAISGIEAAQTPGLLRMGIWSGISSFLLIGAIWRGSRAGARFAKQDRMWLSGRMGNPLLGALLLVLGSMASACLCLGALGLGVELANLGSESDSAPAFAKVRNLPGQDLTVLNAGDASVSETAWVLADPRGQLQYAAKDGTAPHLLFMPRTLAGDGPSALLTITATRLDKTASGAPRESTTTQRIRGATEVLLPVPPGSGDLVLALSHGQDGPPIRLSQVESGLLLPRSSPQLVSVALWQRSSLWIAGAIALALGLGSALGATLGMLLTLAVQLLGFELYFGALLGGLPWVDALTTTGMGFIPVFAGLDAVAGCLLQLILGTLLLARGIRSKSLRGTGAPGAKS